VSCICCWKLCSSLYAERSQLIDQAYQNYGAVWFLHLSVFPGLRKSPVPTHGNPRTGIAAVHSICNVGNPARHRFVEPGSESLVRAAGLSDDGHEDVGCSCHSGCGQYYAARVVQGKTDGRGRKSSFQSDGDEFPPSRLTSSAGRISWICTTLHTEKWSRNTALSCHLVLFVIDVRVH
jgi:hypothetical protein